MKIKALRIRDFRKHKETDVELDTVNVFVGPNGAGKTSIRAAVEYALTGRVLDWTDRAGRGADSLIRLGTKKAVIELDTDRPGKIRREIPGGLQVADWTGTTTLQQERLYSVLALDADAVSAALNTTEFLGMKPDAQKRLLFALAGVRFDPDQVIAAVAVAAPKELLEAINETLSRALARFEDSDQPASFEDVENILREMRRDAKRALATLQADGRAKQGVPATTIPLDQVPAAREQLASLRHQLGQGRQALGALEERTVQRLRLERELAKIQEMLTGKAPPDAEPDVEQLESDLKTAREKEEAARQNRDLFQDEAKQAEAYLTAAEAQVKGAVSLRDVCPMVPGDRVKCPLSREDRDDLVAAVREEVGARKADAERAKYTAATAHREWVHAQLAVKTAEDTLDAARRLTMTRSTEMAEREAARKRRDEIRAVLAAGAGIVEEVAKQTTAVEELQARITKGEGMIKAAEDAADLQAWQRDAAQATARTEKEVAALEHLVEAMGPKGIPARILREKIGPVAAAAKETLERLTGGAYSLEIEVSEGDLRLTVLHDGGKLPASYLSTSECLRVGVVLQHILTGLSGLGILLVDNVETLDPQNRALFMETVLAIAQEADYGTIIVLSTRGDVEPRNPGIPGLAVFLVEPGGVRPLEAGA